ncbi:MAG: DUF58 domain-containing protein [Rubritalea sp.]|uniref:DUF58 domain-containing protein n=1 Tax=Rubritalea sp. TaxID=2109375 RepID=UPI0032425640
MQSLYQLANLGGFSQFIIGTLLYVGPFLLMLWVWKKLKVKPNSLTIHCGLTWLSLHILASMLPDLSPIWWWSLVAWSVLLLADFVILILTKSPQVSRKLPGRFAIEVESEVSLKLTNLSRLPLRVSVYDGLAEEHESDGLPWHGELPANGYTEITYPLRMRQRGRTTVEAAHIQFASFLKFWTRQVRAGESEETRVYPNYEPVIQFALLAIESSPEQMGIVMKNRAGMSKDFHQLRDYQLGDTLSKVDWKATSRKLQLISRDYQEQRDQNVILAVDCGQRMRAMDGDIPQFDHCLNAMLLLAYVALKQGDNVGILSFGGQERWLPPVKGINSMTTILNHLYDYQTSMSPSDYAEAAERLLVRQQRRSLVVFLSNVRGEDGVDLIEPLRLVRKKHVTILANLQEKEVVDRMDEPVESLDDALALGASQIYLDERNAVLNELRSHGVHFVDATAEDLPVALANAYLVARETV